MALTIEGHPVGEVVTVAKLAGGSRKRQKKVKKNTKKEAMATCHVAKQNKKVQRGATSLHDLCHMT